MTIKKKCDLCISLRIAKVYSLELFSCAGTCGFRNHGGLTAIVRFFFLIFKQHRKNDVSNSKFAL